MGIGLGGAHYIAAYAPAPVAVRPGYSWVRGYWARPRIEVLRGWRPPITAIGTLSGTGAKKARCSRNFPNSLAPGIFSPKVFLPNTSLVLAAPNFFVKASSNVVCICLKQPAGAESVIFTFGNTQSVPFRI